MHESHTHRRFFVLGCLSAAIGVAAGAFGAHGLKSLLSPDLLAVYETAVRYQMYHAFGLLAASYIGERTASPLARMSGWCFIGGTIFFSGSLYALTLLGQRWLSTVTPFGGIAFIAGWIVLAAAALKLRAES